MNDGETDLPQRAFDQGVGREKRARNNPRETLQTRIGLFDP
jgi:hypothetical protein